MRQNDTYRPGRRSALLAVLTVLALTAAACGDDGSESPSGEAAAESPTTTTMAERTYRPSANERDLGPGTLAGMTADGSAAYVAATDPARSTPGCEGMPAPHLFAAPLDGSARAPATPDTNEPIDGAVLRSPTSPRVAVVEQCEEFFVDLLVGEEKGATLVGLESLPVHFTEPGAPRLSWSADGRRLIGTQAGAVIAVDPDSGAVFHRPSRHRRGGRRRTGGRHAGRADAIGCPGG